MGELGQIAFNLLEEILANDVATEGDQVDRSTQEETVIGMRGILLTQARQIDECIYLLEGDRRGRAPLSTGDSEINLVITGLLHMIGISAHSLVRLTDEAGLGAKDGYPIARSIIEGAVNIAYLMASDAEVARKAQRHAQVRAFRDLSRQSKVGGLTIEVSFQGEIPVGETQRLEAMAAEFTSAKGHEKDWTDLSWRQRLDAAALVFPDTALLSLHVSAFSIYRHASEVMHGSYYSALMIWGVTTPKSKPFDRESLRSVMLDHQISALSASIFALAGVVECFADYANVPHLKFAVTEVLRRLSDLPEVAESLRRSKEAEK